MRPRRPSQLTPRAAREGNHRAKRSRRVNVLRIRQFLLATVIAMVAVACGSGGSGMSQSSGATPLIATGTITGFGSVYVNGIHFQTTSAAIRKNGQTVDQSQLAVGEVARIKGSKDDVDDTGVADEVDVDEAVIGPIDKIDTTGGTVTVLAQIVKINAGTSVSKNIQPADITGLKTGDVIHVSGMTDSSGAIVATRIEKGSASSPLQVVGTVAALNVKVEVEGMLNSSNVLVASVVAFEHNGDIDLQGPAANVSASAGTLTVLGVPVTVVTSSTRFEDDSSNSMAMFNLSNVSAGDTVRVHGFESPAGSGKVVATRLERLPPSPTVIVKGPFMAGSSPDFTILGITIDGSAATIGDGQGGMMPLATFFTQAAGHEVRVEGTLSGTTVMASRISIDDHTGDEG